MKDLPHVPSRKIFANSKRILQNPLPFHRENFEKLGDTFRISIPGEGKVIFSRNPDWVKQILQKQHRSFEKSKLQTKDLAKYIGKGLLTAEGEHWRKHRRMIQPAFNASHVQRLLPIIQTTIQKEVGKLKQDVPQDAHGLMGDLAFQVVAKSLFSKSDIGKTMHRLKEITEINQNMLVREMRRPYLTWWFDLTGQTRKHLNFSKEAQDLLNALIEKRSGDGVGEKDLLDLLLSSTYEDGTPISRGQLIDEVMILFTAGHETTANALAFTLYFIAQDEKLQKRLTEEVETFYASDSLQNLSKMEWTIATIKEAMRIFPPVYVIDRVSSEKVEVAGTVLEKGTLVLLSIYELHRTATFWKEPETFEPERFLKKDMKQLGGHYYPFGAGPRMCIGNTFAHFEMVLAIAEILKRYTISTPMDSVDINPLITLKPKEVKLVFSDRWSGI
ncbi:MAG: cytochrome P450 [Bacteroidota bacterium]